MIQALRDELTGDPLERAYASMTDAEVLASLLAVNRSRSRRVSSLEMLLWGGANGRLARVRKAAQKQPPYDSLPDEVWSAAIVADAMVTRQDAGFDPRQAEHLSLVDGLVAAQVLTADDKTALLALATEPCSRADELGLVGLGIGHIAEARAV